MPARNLVATTNRAGTTDRTGTTDRRIDALLTLLSENPIIVTSGEKIARELGHAGEPHRAIVIAEEQTCGRGRAGRSWHSEKTSGIYMSALLRSQISPIVAPVITLVAALAVRDAVQEKSRVAADLRWPNDLLASGKKFGGILTEMYAEPSQVR